MKTITITKVNFEKERARKRYERKDKYERQMKVIRQFNKEFSNTIGRKVSIKRINQALATYGYAHASGPHVMPAWYYAGIDNNGEISLSTGYRNVDDIEWIN